MPRRGAGGGVWGSWPSRHHFKGLPHLQPLPSPAPCVPCSGGLQGPPGQSPLPEEEERQRPRDQNHRDVREAPPAGVRGLGVRRPDPGARRPVAESLEPDSPSSSEPLGGQPDSALRGAQTTSVFSQFPGLGQDRHPFPKSLHSAPVLPLPPSTLPAGGFLTGQTGMAVCFTATSSLL